MYEINFPLSFLNKFCITQKKRRFHTKYTEEQTKREEEKNILILLNSVSMSCEY